MGNLVDIYERLRDDCNEQVEHDDVGDDNTEEHQDESYARLNGIHVFVVIDVT